MPSNARKTLAANSADIERLKEIHEKESGDGRGRKYDVEVLNKAAVVFVCAAWEAFCEDLVRESIGHIVADCSDPGLIPPSLRKIVADTIRKHSHEHAPWQMAGDGWRRVVRDHADATIQKLTGSWNTPKTAQVKTLFQQSLGIDDITASWRWQKSPVAKTTSTLDWFVALRGEIAHRLNTTAAVYKGQGAFFFVHISRIADLMDADVVAVLLTVTGRTYW